LKAKGVDGYIWAGFAGLEEYLKPYAENAKNYGPALKTLYIEENF